MTLYSGIPPKYEGPPRSSTSSEFSQADTKSTLGAPTRYLYYQIFEDETAVPSKQQVPDFDEPSIGRIRARNIAPPRTVRIIKRAILKAEAIEPSRISSLFLDASDSSDALDDEVRLDVTDQKGTGPGSSPDSPIGIVLGLGQEEVARAVMSRTEPGLVASAAKPKGWKEGKTTGSSIYLVVATKSDGGYRWMDGTIRPGQSIFVDVSSLTNITDGGTVYSVYPVIFAVTRHYGFMPASSIELSKNASTSFKDLLGSF